MILANFDLSFFTSIPGMLITGGVLLLLIALIIFIATSPKKEKKSKKEENNELQEAPTVSNEVATVEVSNVGDNPQNVAAPNNGFDSQVVPVPQEVNEAPTNQNQVEIEAPVEPTIVNPTVEPTIEPVKVNNEPINQVEPQVIPVVNMEPVQNVAPIENTSNVETFENSSNMGIVNNDKFDDINKTVASAEPITIVNEEEKIEPQVATVQEEPKTIYGGASPVIPKIEVEGEQHRPIYGGANPLENTQSIPRVNVSSSPIPVVTPTINEAPKMEEPKIEPQVVNPTVTEIPTPVIENKEVKKAEEVESLF